MDRDLGADDFQSAAAQLGLKLTAKEAQEAIAGVNRWLRNVQLVRKHIAKDVEPAVVFWAPTDKDAP